MKIKKLIKMLLLISMVLVTIFILANQIDEELDPELKAIIDKTYPILPDDQNAFFAYVGFYAAEGDDIVETGKRILKEYENTVSSSKSLDFDVGKILGPNPIELEDDGIQVCSSTNKRSYCMAHIRQSLDKIEPSIINNRVLIDRYYSLYKFKRFQSNSSYLPTTPFSTHKYVIKDIAHKWINGSRKEAVALLIDDIKFHRMLGTETRLLIDKMIALAGLSHSYGLLHDFINECHSCVLEDERINSVLMSLDEEMLLSHRVMEGEVKWSYATTMEMLESSSSRHDYFEQAMRWEAAGEPGSNWYGLLGYVTLVNATINEGFRSVQKPNLNLSKHKFKEYEKQLTLTRIENEQDNYNWWEYFYNPGGKYLSSLYDLDPIYSRYFELPFQLEARIRLIRLQSLIKKNKIEKKNISVFLNQQPLANQNPYSDEPIKYNASENIIYIVPFDSVADMIVVYL